MDDSVIAAVTEKHAELNERLKSVFVKSNTDIAEEVSCSPTLYDKYYLHVVG